VHTLENETDTLDFTRSPKPEKETSTKTTGLSSPLGATVTANGVNFSVFSRRATSIELLFFEREDDARPIASTRRIGRDAALDGRGRIFDAGGHCLSSESTALPMCFMVAVQAVLRDEVAFTGD